MFCGLLFPNLFTIKYKTNFVFSNSVTESHMFLVIFSAEFWKGLFGTCLKGASLISICLTSLSCNLHNSNN